MPAFKEILSTTPHHAPHTLNHTLNSHHAVSQIRFSAMVPLHSTKYTVQFSFYQHSVQAIQSCPNYWPVSDSILRIPSISLNPSFNHHTQSHFPPISPTPNILTINPTYNTILGALSTHHLLLESESFLFYSYTLHTLLIPVTSLSIYHQLVMIHSCHNHDSFFVTIVIHSCHNHT